MSARPSGSTAAYIENLIKLRKTQLASDRTSCRSALANQVRLVLHTASYWLMLTVRDAIPRTRSNGGHSQADARKAAPLLISLTIYERGSDALHDARS
jgi:hypothetical protein